MRPLADDIYAACANPSKMISHFTPEGARKLGETIKQNMREARRFYIDEEVTRAATHLGVQHPDILMSMLRRARLPFDKCWVEWDNHAQTDEAGGPIASDAPTRAGALIERLSDNEARYRMTTIGMVENNGRMVVVSSPLTVIYDLDKPVSNSGEDLVASVSKLPVEYVRQSVVGGAYMNSPRTKNFLEDDEEKEHRHKLCDALSAHATNTISPYMAEVVAKSVTGSREYNPAAVTKIIRNEVVENCGTWRFVVSLFALINARDYVDSEKKIRQGNNRSVGAKVVPFLDHWIVSLKMPRKIVQARVIKDMIDAIPVRRHEVMGHWRQKVASRMNCDHAYVDETPSRQVCVVEGCGHKRWFVKEFMRGSAQVGIIIKDRLVEMG